MPLLADRVLESTTTTGTGTFALGGALTGYRTFNSAFSNGDVVFYTADNGLGEWEVGYGTVGTGTLTRNVIESSNANALVPFSAGVKRLFCTAPAQQLPPNQTGNSGKYLTTSGTSMSWATLTPVTSVTGTAPIASSGGTTPAISISQSSSTTNGYLSSTDWTTFNNKTSNTGTVTSVAMTVPTGLSISGTPITTSGTLALTLTAGYSIPTTASQTNWDSAYTQRLQWDGGSTNLVAATGRTSLGGTTIGQNVFTLTNPSAVTFPRFNADNTVSALDAATFRTAIGAGTSSTTGTVTSVATSGAITGGTITTTGTISHSTADGYLHVPATSTTNNGKVLTAGATAGSLSWQTPTTGTVTSVSGTGTVSGISLSGTVTTTGSLTLGGSLDLSSPPAIGGTAANTGKFSTLTATGTTTLATSLTGLLKATAGVVANTTATLPVKNRAGTTISVALSLS